MHNFRLNDPTNLCHIQKNIQSEEITFQCSNIKNFHYDEVFSFSFKFAIEPSLAYTVQSLTPKLTILHEPTGSVIAELNHLNNTHPMRGPI